MDCCCMASCFLLLFLAFSVFFILRKHCICIILPRFIGQGTVRQSCAHCCHMVIFSSSFILSFLLIIFWKYRGSELYCCHAAIFCLSSLFFLLPPVYSLRILGFWLFLEKRGRGKGGWEADLLASWILGFTWRGAHKCLKQAIPRHVYEIFDCDEDLYWNPYKSSCWQFYLVTFPRIQVAWDFCGYFLLLFLIFYPLKTLFFGIFEKRDGKKRGKQGVFCWRFKHGNGEEKRGEREKKQEDFGWVFIWIYRELSKNYFL